jgi:uncharacterized phiE125 gp8 family phage protein
MIADIEVVTPPDVEPVELTEGIQQARGIVAGQEDLFTRKLIAAREMGEKYTRRSFISQTLAVWLDRWDGVGVIELPRGNVQEVVSVTTYDDYNQPTVADSDIYYLLSGNTLLFNSWLPYYRPSRGIKVLIKSGYGDDPEDVPALIREGILEYAVFLYENRLGEAPEAKYAAMAQKNGIPSGVADKWDQFKIRMT